MMYDWWKLGNGQSHINAISDELKHVGQFEEVEKWLNLDKLGNEWTFYNTL